MIIRLQGIGKRFRRYERRTQSIIERVFLMRRSKFDWLWALKDIDLDVEKGAMLGIVGVNGSGKSTLFKVICGILKPTEGSVAVDGRVSALLELGAGFHPQLTGRENVYLYGSILGLKKEEIDERFDEIVAFAGLMDFIDNPLKSYSSGMVIRLGFSTAVTVDPDIILIDEALGVGDAVFAQKSIEKVREYNRKGTTVLIVSHILNTITSTCPETLWLNAGKIETRGETPGVINEYLHFLREHPHRLDGEREQGRGEESLEELPLEILEVESLDAEGRECNLFGDRKPIRFRIAYRSRGMSGGAKVQLAVQTERGEIVSGPVAVPFEIDASGKGMLEMEIAEPPILNGTFHFLFSMLGEGADEDVLNLYGIRSKPIAFSSRTKGFGYVDLKLNLI
jgi:ABC-type polysaccharide/polyol phosphate transport system ATPase subunit